MRESAQIFVGLPMAGKTSFLAALWHVLDQPEVPTSLKLSQLPPSREYLNYIRDAWFACRTVDRTPLSSREVVTLHVEDSTTGDAARLIFPDLAGENFIYHIRERRWDEEFDGFVAKANGIVLFVNPAVITEPIPLEVLEAHAAAIGDEGAHVREADDSGEEPNQPWEHRHLPTQAQLVELLQMLRWRKANSESLRVAIIVSAWDLVSGQGQTPGEWIAARLPLLHQFCVTNADWLATRSYGVSAQGAHYSAQMVESLRDMPKQSSRVIVAGVDCGPHDITGPITWLLSGRG